MPVIGSMPSESSVRAVVCLAGVAVLLCAPAGWGDTVSLGYAENQSYTTLCAEVDNINIPLLYSNASAFRITATHPDYYPTSIDERGADFTDCEFTDRIIWRIGTNDGSNAESLPSGFTDPDEYFALDNPGAGSDEAVSNFPKEINSDWMNNQFIRFTAAEAGDANTELTIGAVLTLDFTALNGTLEIKCRTWNGSGWTDHGNQLFDSGNLTKQWTIPDFTWLEGVDANNIHLDVVTAGEGGASTAGAWGLYDHLELKKRDEAGETVHPALYDDGNVKIEAITIDFWWRAPRVMEVSVIGGSTVTNAHYFRIIKRMPEAVPSYNEIFVYYQDGNARIIPFPPTNVSWVPYGASVQIGATPDSQRPFTDVDTVVIDPVDLSADITFLDASEAHIELSVDRDRHVVDVNGITYNTTTTAFARMRSMWVADGKADIDRVTSQQGVFPMHKDWTRLDGTWWTFDHAVPSYHNTYCPDFEIEVMATQLCYSVLQAESPLSGSNTTIGFQADAANGSTLCMSASGSEAHYTFPLAYDRPGSRLVIRYADEDGGDNGVQRGNSVDVFIDGVLAERIYTVNTGGTNAFELLPSVELGDLVQGVHTVKLVTGAGPGAMYLDELRLMDRRQVRSEETLLVTVEGESWIGGTNHTTSTRPSASGGMTVHMEVTGAVPSEVEYTVNMPSSCSNVFVRTTYSDDVGPNKVEFFLDGEPKGKFPSESTGGWDTFGDAAPLFLGDVASGVHTVKLVASIETFGVDIDKFDIFKSDKLNRVPQLFVPASHQLAVGSTTNFTVTAFDPDGDLLVVSNAAAPVGSTFVCDEFSWMADAASGGTTALVVFVAGDGRGTTNSVVTNSATITVPYDADSDNLADGWEWLNFTTLVYLASNDVDLDGFDNLSEFLAGTAPMDGDSLFVIDALGAIGPESPCEVMVRTEPGKIYAIYYADGSVTDGSSWLPFANSANGIGTWVETNSVSTVYTFIDDFGADTTGGEPAGGMRQYHIQVSIP